MFKQAIPKLRLSIEQDTRDVPDDGQYHVVLADDVIYSGSSESGSMAFYRAKRDELIAQAGGSVGEAPPDPAEVLRREREHLDTQAARSDSFARRAARGRPKGGKGGRGGV